MWHFGLFDGGPAIGSDHDVEAPQVWVRALEAGARDLRCLRYGRDVRLGGLVWELAVNGDYAVTIGWRGVRGISGFSRCDGFVDGCSVH